MTAAGRCGKFSPKHDFLFSLLSLSGEQRFHLSLVPAGAYHVGGELVAQNEIDGLENEAFSRAGFAREDVHAVAEFKFHVVDECQAAYAQIFQHEFTRKRLLEDISMASSFIEK